MTTAEVQDVDKKIRDTRLDTLSIVLMFYMLFTGLGLIWIGNNIQESYTYILMKGLMSIKVWGIIFCANAVFYLISILVEYKRWQYMFFMIAGLTGSILMGLYSIASFETSIYKIHSFRYVLFVGIHLTVFIKGVSAWRKEKLM